MQYLPPAIEIPSEVADDYRNKVGCSKKRFTRVTIILPLIILFLLSHSWSARAASHALLIAISDYTPSKYALPGVKQDVGHAREMARLLGVPVEQIISMADSAAGSQQLLDALDSLARRVGPNDHVFIYFSGHGTRKSDPAQPGQCRDYLISFGTLPEYLTSFGTTPECFLDEQQFKQKIKKIAERAGQVLVFLDACHSGGMKLTRSLAQPHVKELTETSLVKSIPNEDGCQIVRNRSLSKSLQEERNNITVIAASQADEIARIAQNNSGSYATLAWLACMRDTKRSDTDRSGGISGGELLACGQQEIDRLAALDGKPNQHLVLEGNAEALMGFVPPAVSIAPSPPPAPALQSPIIVPAESSSAAPVAASSPAAALRELYASRDPNWPVSLSADQQRYRIGQDVVRLRVVSERPGYLYLLQHTADNRTACLLFPNNLDQVNSIGGTAGEIRLDESRGWGITPQGSLAGTATRDTITAIVATKPLDLTQVALMAEGPFQCTAATAQPEALARMTRVFAEDGDGRGTFGGARVEIEEYK